MHTFLSTIIPCISSCHERDEPRVAVSSTGAERLEALAKTCRLSDKGSQALMQWTCWLSYAATQAEDPHIMGVPGWKTILPIDTEHAQEHLYQVLLRAGEPKQTALRTAIKCYPNMHIPTRDSFLLPAPLQGERLLDGIAAFTTNDLPAHAVPFETLPAWAREMALFSTDLTAKSLAEMPALAGLDLRFLNLYCAKLDGLDLRNCDFLRADMRRATIAYADIGRARMDDSIKIRGDGELERSYPPRGQFDTSGKPRQTKVDFFHDREILQVLARTRRVENLDIGYLEDGKTIIQQQAQRGWSAAVSAMLIADHGGKVDEQELQTCNLGNDADVLRHLKGATDYSPVTSCPKSIKALADQLTKHGPAIVSLNGELGNHFIIVDAIDLAHHVAQLRDPFHGWAIKVPLVAFTSRWSPSTERIIQLSAPGTENVQPAALWA